MAGQRKPVAKVALILIILVGVVALLSLTFKMPGKLGEPILLADFLSHPSMPVVFLLLFFLGVLLAVYLGDRFNLLFLLPLLLVAIPPTLNRQTDFVTPGAVMAFHLDECPVDQGWEPFDPAQNRVVVGTGPARKDKLGINLSERPLGSLGGAERRVITGSELPKHNHDRGDYNRLVIANKENTASSRSRLDKEDPSVTNEVNLLKSATIKPWGQAKPRAHDSMPPYVALRYCIKR